MPINRSVEERKKVGAVSQTSLSIKSLQQAKGRTDERKKKKAETQKREQLHTHSKDKKKRKKETWIERVTSNREDRFVYAISSVFFSKSLSPSFSNLNSCLGKQIGLGFMRSS